MLSLRKGTPQHTAGCSDWLLYSCAWLWWKITTQLSPLPTLSSFPWQALLSLSLSCCDFERWQAALRGSDAAHLGWSLTCSAEMERLAWDTWKHLTRWIHSRNPGVHYNGENHFGEGNVWKDNKAVGNVSETTTRPLYFLLVSFSDRSWNRSGGKSNHFSSIISPVSLPCLWK